MPSTGNPSCFYIGKKDSETMHVSRASQSTYIRYTSGSSFYYEAPARDAEGQKDALHVPPLPAQWRIVKTDFWTNVINANQNWPDQGWKIHISTIPEDAQTVLFTVANFLFRMGVSFKFVSSLHLLRYQNSKYAIRSGSGKFITVYPSNTSDFTSLLDSLMSITAPFAHGPSILSDKEWKQSNVYFRYGGFKPIYQFVDGEKVLSIRTPSGQLIKDRREPQYTPPSFADEPPSVLKNNNFYELPAGNPLNKYSIRKALNFTNAGGVYLASIGDKQVVLKEGRKHAGLDPEGRDGFQRARNEYVNLKALENVPGIVRPIEWFVAWRHCYLCEEYVSGETLQSFIARRFPFLKSQQQREKTNGAYLRDSISIAKQLKSTIRKAHALGVAISDISPTNIMVTDTGHGNPLVTIIDLESAVPVESEFNSSINTPGFIIAGKASARVQDWYAWGRIARYLLFPAAPVSAFAPCLEVPQDQEVERIFGNAALEFLRDCSAFIQSKGVAGGTGATRSWRCLPKGSPCDESRLNSVTSKLAEGLMDALNREVLPSDPAADEMPFGHANILTGYSGVLLALARYVRREKNPDAQETLNGLRHNFENRLATTDLHEQPIGLFVGKTGVAATALELGLDGDCDDILRTLRQEDLKRMQEDISLTSGLSGIGIFLMASGKRPDLLPFIAQSTAHSLSQWEPSDNQDACGLLTGVSGAVLFLWKHSLINGDARERATALRTLNSLSSRLKQLPDSDALSPMDRRSDVSTAVPYLENGAAGFALLLAEIDKDDPNALSDSLKSRLKGTLEACDIPFSYNASLISGFSGLIPVAQYSATRRHRLGMLARLLQAQDSFLLENGSRIYVPGWMGLKCSSDYESGAAGVLLALESCRKTLRWDAWFPAPSNRLALFRADKCIPPLGGEESVNGLTGAELKENR